MPESRINDRIKERIKRLTTAIQSRNDQISKFSASKKVAIQRRDHETAHHLQVRIEMLESVNQADKETLDTLVSSPNILKSIAGS